MWKIFTIILVSQLTAISADAQLLDQLKGGLGGMPGIPSVDQASPSNLAGVLQYCVQNNYVNDGAASSVKDSLVSKVTGHNPPDNQFRSGSSGVLETGNGNTFSLGGGIKEQATKKVCDLVLSHARSLL
jgi:hypothetical protein